MLNEYKDIEPIIYKSMINCINRSLSHAYLFDLNGNVYAKDMVMSFVKSILCKVHTSKEECENCITCKRIDDDNYPDVKKIYPDGINIKKNQLDELQDAFSTKSLENTKRIYIIYDAEKLNGSAANSLLKFLEEPNEGIIAILLTNNINQVINTIISRCQVMTFNKNKVSDYIKYNDIIKNVTYNKLLFTVFKISNEKDITEEMNLFLDNVIKFIEAYESNGVKLIVYMKEHLDNFKEKSDLINLFECLILFYKDVLNVKLNRKIEYYDDFYKLIEKVNDKYTTKQIIQKLDVLIQKEKNIKYNVNVNMLIDSLLIDMEV